MEFEVKDFLSVFIIGLLGLFAFFNKMPVEVFYVVVALIIGLYLGNGIALSNTKQVLEAISESVEDEEHE